MRKITKFELMRNAVLLAYDPEIQKDYGVSTGSVISTTARLILNEIDFVKWYVAAKTFDDELLEDN